ncbi:MAG: phosphogluconate dehydrogenase (NAD(+)-dependent, decarboxylating) [Pseudomonadota bacterium]
MEIGIVGLGRMGAGIARRLMSKGHQCVVYDVDPAAVLALETEGARGATTLAELVDKLTGPRVVWVMVPSGAITEETLAQLRGLVQADDVLIDGGNSFYKDSARHGAECAELGLEFLDVGTSGGVWGLERGYCLMIGGTQKAFSHVEPIFEALAPGIESAERTPGRSEQPVPAEQGYAHVGPHGAGHFTKMIHNGIEYGIMQAYAEGLAILDKAVSEERPQELRFDIDPGQVAEVWRRGSVVSSWLLDLTAEALARDRELSEFAGHVPDSGEGRWTIEAAIEEAVPANVLSAALFARFRSRTEVNFADQVLSAMRAGFGGHTEKQ